MCVTNTTHRRFQAVQLPPAKVGVCPSALSQRLLGTFSFPQAAEAQPENAVSNEFAGEKIRPRRRRKPQKPGKTAKMNDRHFVVHNYHDHAYDVDEHDVEDDISEEEQPRRGGVSIAFPVKLHAVLDQVEVDGLADVVSWQPHGRCFVVHKPKEFVGYVMPKYFRQTKLTSFQRQLNLYGFNRVTRGPDAGGYYHELFLRGKDFLCKKMMRTKVKGTGYKAASSPEHEPDFYQMPPVVVTPPGSSDEEMSFGSSGTSETRQILSSNVMSVPLQFSYYQQPLMYSPGAAASVPSFTADRILDEAVDELFIGDSNDSDNLADFVHDWDPSNSFGDLWQSDAQLGFMLDRLLAN